MRVETIGDATGPRDGITAIYALCEPNGSPRYVGKTVNWMHIRHKQHIRAAKRSGRKLPVHSWIRQKIESKEHLCISLLEYVPAGGDWARRERFWVDNLRSDGAPLLNLTEGGEGMVGRVMPDEQRKKIAEAIKTGATFNCNTCGAAFWRKRNEIKRGECKFCSRECYARSNKGVSKPVPAICTERGLAVAAAKRRAQTYCKYGHPLSGDNLFLTTTGGRGCKSCRRRHKAAYLARINANG